jgi:hypothetical protein
MHTIKMVAINKRKNKHEILHTQFRLASVINIELANQQKHLFRCNKLQQLSKHSYSRK